MKSTFTRKVKNNKPEKEIEREFMARCWQHGFDLSVVESKAVFSERIGRYVRGSTNESMTDIVGNWGPIAVYIELKAKGRLSTFNNPKNFKQIHFVERKLDSGAFVMVTDSFDDFLALFNKWVEIENELEKKSLLKDALPKKKI